VINKTRRAVPVGNNPRFEGSRKFCPWANQMTVFSAQPVLTGHRHVIWPSSTRPPMKRLSTRSLMRHAPRGPDVVSGSADNYRDVGPRPNLEDIVGRLGPWRGHADRFLCWAHQLPECARTAPVSVAIAESRWGCLSLAAYFAPDSENSVAPPPGTDYIDIDLVPATLAC